MSLAPQGFPLLGWHHLIDATAANREALWNQARRHLHPFPFPFLGLDTGTASRKALEPQARQRLSHFESRNPGLFDEGAGGVTVVGGEAAGEVGGAFVAEFVGDGFDLDAGLAEEDEGLGHFQA